jgi:uncharacterized protein (DUF1330 family)
MNTVNHFPPTSQAATNHTAEGVSAHPQKAYLIAHIDVADAQRYALYQDIDDDAFTRYGGRFIVRGGTQQALVGALKTRTIVVEFETMSVALACYNSVESQSAMNVRLSLSTADAVIVEGYGDASGNMG